jgi:hypothetical protein
VDGVFDVSAGWARGVGRAVRDLGAELTVLGVELADVSVGEGEVLPKGGF